MQLIIHIEISYCMTLAALIGIISHLGSHLDKKGICRESR